MKVLVGAIAFWEVEKVGSGGRMGFCLKSPENSDIASSAAREFPFYRKYKGWRGFLIGYRHKEFPQMLFLRVISTLLHPEADRALDKINRKVSFYFLLAIDCFR